MPARTMSEAKVCLKRCGLLVKASAPFLYLLAQSWPWLLAARFYHGLSTALYVPDALTCARTSA